MSACSQCNADVADNAVWYLPNGAVGCTPCYNAALARQADERARAASVDYGVPGSVPDSPAKLMVKGAGLFGLGVAWLVVGVVFLDRLYFYPLFLLLPGFGIFARGLHLYRSR